MGKVFLFPGATISSPIVETGDEISSGSFMSALTSPEALQRVSLGVTRTFRMKNFEVKTPVRTILKSNSPVGSIPGNFKSELGGIVVSPQFPLYLMERQGLDNQESQEVAATYVHAYALATKGLMKTPRFSGRHESTQVPELWVPSFRPPSRSALPHRLAANITLSAHSLLPPRTHKPEHRLPPEVSALYNPLAPDQVSAFHSVIMTGNKV